jgi:hypothetical protein
LGRLGGGTDEEDGEEEGRLVAAAGTEFRRVSTMAWRRLAWAEGSGDEEEWGGGNQAAGMAAGRAACGIARGDGLTREEEGLRRESRRGDVMRGPSVGALVREASDQLVILI